MTQTELETFCDQWLQAWTGNQPEKLLAYYHKDVLYRDPYLKTGAKGHEQLLLYFGKLLGANPNWTWTRDELWPVDGGFAMNWVAEIPLKDGSILHETGMDIVLLQDGKIIRNGVYFDRSEWLKSLEQK